jgi:hypothetical protein
VHINKNTGIGWSTCPEFADIRPILKGTLEKNDNNSDQNNKTNGSGL